MAQAGTGTPGITAPAGFSARAAALGGSAAALAVATLMGSLLTFWHQEGCRAGGFVTDAGPLRARCYSDIYTLYFARGLRVGQIPYLDHPLEYPVLIGAAMQAAAAPFRSVTPWMAQGRDFYDLTTAGLVLCAITGVLATAYLAGRSRRWTALLVALSPALILAAFVNWDLLAMALTTTAMAAWAARRGVLAGVLFGLAISTLFYPLLLLAALFPLCLRARQLRAFWVTTGTATVTWLVVNVPVAIMAFSGWSLYYRHSVNRIADWGSVWYLIRTEAWDMNAATVDALGLVLTLTGFALVGVLVLAAPRRPRVPQVFFLTLAVFLMFGKIWTPENAIWLVPLVVLARPRLWSFLLWQAAEVSYFFAIFPYLLAAQPAYYEHQSGGIGAGPYFAALLARFITVALLCALVARDILRPEKDMVRRGGVDDPAGGVLDGAPDAVITRSGGVILMGRMRMVGGGSDS